MKDVSRLHPIPSSRCVPYRKRRSSSSRDISPTRATRRVHDASLPQVRSYACDTTSPSSRENGLYRDEAQTSCAAPDPSADERRHHDLSKIGGNHAISRARRHTSADGSARERPSLTSALSTQANVPGPSLRLPLTPGLSTTSTSTGQRRAESPAPPGSVTAFLRSIELPNNPPGAFPSQKPISISALPSLCLPLLSTDTPNKVAYTKENGHQVSLVYKGYPFIYDLSALPDDPKGTIALLSITKSDPGAYILVGAHYRRTGRSRAARAVIRSLLDSMDSLSDVKKEKGDAVPMSASATSTTTLVSPGSPCPKPIGSSRPVVKSTAMRPAVLLLAACELDISRECVEDPESAGHASAAHDLFRAIYGTMNDAIVAGAARPQPNNALGLDFSGSKSCLVSSSLSDANNHPQRSGPPPGVELTRIKDLEKELNAARAARKNLQEELTVSNERLKQAEDKVHALESHSRETLVQLDAARDQNWELRRRLADSEQRARELVHCAPSAESRVWGRLKDLLFDNLAGGVRGM